MIPIRDTIRSKTYPVVNTALIGINVIVFLFQPSSGPYLERFAYLYGLVPARYTVTHIADYFSLDILFLCVGALCFAGFVLMHCPVQEAGAAVGEV